MSREAVVVRAPSNIALVKYMGKIEGSANLPMNPSLSMTLSELCTVVEIAPAAKSGTEWIAELPRYPSGESFRFPPQIPRLSDASIEKFTSHVERFRVEASRLYSAFEIPHEGLTDGIEIRSANTFPHSSGIASSASSFAALTTALYFYFATDRKTAESRFQSDTRLRSAWASLSRAGSGSSCRSFFGPFAQWDGEQVVPVASALPPLSDIVCVVSSAPKTVSSSEAHRRVRTSPLWGTRMGAVGPRFTAVREAIREGELKRLSKLALSEAMEMHELFHTSAEPFSYLTPESEKLLAGLDAAFGPGVLLTLDAGPNLHVLVPSERREEVVRWLKEFAPETRLLIDESSDGPRLISRPFPRSGGAR